MSLVTLSLKNADGTKRRNKHKTSTIFVLKNKEEQSSTEHSVYSVDFFSDIRTMTEIPRTFEALGWNLIKSLPNGYNHVDIFWPVTYAEDAIKSMESKEKGGTDKYKN